MSDRIIRDEILESERFVVELRDVFKRASIKLDSPNLQACVARMAYVALLLKADALGNLEGGEARLGRLWGSFGIVDELVPTIRDALVEVDLVRLYSVDKKQYLHLPRYRQNLRYVKRVFPPSPWTTDQEKHALAKNSRGEHMVRATSPPREHTVRTVEVKRSEVKRTGEHRDVESPRESGAVDKSTPIDIKARQRHTESEDLPPEEIERRKGEARRMIALAAAHLKREP